jgi:hypothetical protein
LVIGEKHRILPEPPNRKDLLISQLLSLLRLAAALGIFIYHFSTLYGPKIAGTFIPSIYAFCFLSGYLAYTVQPQPLNWLVRRIYAIMVPYWFVIIPVLFCNRMILYKETSVAKDIISLLGGSLFLDNPVYIISWYVTLVLLLYLFIFMQSLANNRIQLLFIWLAAMLFFEVVLHMFDFFMLFSFGFVFSQLQPPPRKSLSQANRTARILFFLQDKCYAFFLIHGGVLLLLFQSGYLRDGYEIFITGFLLTGLGAVLLRKITKPVIEILVNRTNNAILFKTVLPRIIRTL